jgi:hypothetical protein
MIGENMKKLIVGLCGLILLVYVIFINSCSGNADSQFRIRNDQVNKVSLNVQAAEDKKISINNVEPGEITGYKTAAVGNMTVTDVVKNESVSFLVEKNTRYTIIVSADKPPTFNIDK